MGKRTHRSTREVLKMRSKIRSFGDLKKVFAFTQQNLNLGEVFAGVTDPRQEPQIPLDKVLYGQVLGFVGLSKNMLEAETMFCSRRLLGMLNVGTRRLISDSRAMEISAMLGGMQFQKEALVPLVKGKLHLLQNKEEYLKDIKHVAIDLTTCSGFGVIDPVATGSDFSLPLGAVVPSYYLADEERKKEFDKYRSKDSLVAEYKKEREMTKEEKEQAEKACKGRGYEIPASKIAVAYIIESFGKGTFNMISADAKHFCYSEMRWAKERGCDMLIRIRKDDDRNLRLIEELEDVIETSKKLNTKDPSYGEAKGIDKKRGIRWKLQTLLVLKKDSDIKELPCDVVVCKLTQESLDGSPLDEDEREKYLVVTKTDISYDAIYEISKRHWEVEEQHKNLAANMNMKHIWSHDPAAVWTLFVLMLIATLTTTLYFAIVVVYVFGKDELRKQKIGLLTILRIVQKNWEARRLN